MAILFWSFFALILQVWARPSEISSNINCKAVTQPEQSGKILTCGDNDDVNIYKLSGRHNRFFVTCKTDSHISRFNYNLNFHNQDSDHRISLLQFENCKMENLNQVINMLDPKGIQYLIITGKVNFNISKSDNFQRLQNLEKLSFMFSKSVTIQPNALDNLKLLQKITIQYNGNIRLSKMRLQHLRKLIIDSNKHVMLSDNFFEEMPRLEILHLRKFASLDSTTFSDLPNLQVLDLSNSHIDDLPSNLFTGSRKLQYLYLQENNLKTLNGDIFKDLLNLRKLNISNNQINNLPENVFTSLKELRYLDLKRNNLKQLKDTIFYDLTNLQVLDISNNQIENIPYNLFTRLTKLNYLYLQRNQFETLNDKTFNGLSELRKVSLSENQVKLSNELLTKLRKQGVLHFK